jgi:hypothetical protein
VDRLEGMQSGKWRQWGFALAAMVMLMGLRYGYDHLMRKESRAADAVEAFAREGLESVRVYSIEPVRRMPPGDAGDEVLEAYLEEKVTEEHFHQYPVVRTRMVMDAAEAQKLVQEVAAGMRRVANPSACFDPRHGLRIVNHQGACLDVVLCFSCNQVEVWQIGPRGGRWELVRGTITSGPQGRIDGALD